MLSPSSLHLSPSPKTPLFDLNKTVILLSKSKPTNYPQKNSHNPPPFLSHRKTRVVCLSCSNSPVPLTPSDDDRDVELGRLLALLPEEMRRRVGQHPELRQLIEVVMDLGRKPLARFPTGDFVLSEYPISVDDLVQATSMVGDFAIDNRAGISRTLHRISAIRNRKGSIIGLTCRVGRAVSGSANLLRDLVQDGASLLLIGPPGVGKTTIIRDIARMLANDYMKRVMIVDTSNEIGGDGDIPHAGIGNARRMQVASSDMQHKVLIEAVENHMPQVIVIDEIGTKLEAIAASTIAQRGIQLVATAHGVTIENLTMNPSLEMLVGGIQSVTLGDEEASRRGVQKTILERKGPSTFSCGVEIISKSELRVHRKLEATVDAILSGRCPYYEVRRMNQGSEAKTAEGKPFIRDSLGAENEFVVEYTLGKNDETPTHHELSPEMPQTKRETSSADGARICLYVYGIPEESVMQGFKQVMMYDEVKLTDNINEADALLAVQSKLKKNPRIQDAARSHAIPIYVVKTSALPHLTKAIRALIAHHDGFKDFDLEDRINPSQKIDALEEARVAIEQVVIPKGQPVELLPRPPNIISLQEDLVRKYKLQSKKIGTEPNECVRILPFQNVGDEDGDSSEGDDADGEFDEFSSLNSEMNGSPYIVNRLPLLPE